MTDIIHITPEFPPDHGGVSDYAERVFAHGEDAGLRQLVFSSVADGVFRCPQISAAHIDHASLKRKLIESAPSQIVLHYSPYGYARWGLCGDLVRTLSDVVRECNGLKIITILHEGYASGPPFNLAFWTSFPQRANLKHLSDCSHRIITASPHLAAKVDDWAGEKFAEFIPVFSNVGEPDSVKQWNERHHDAVIFGGASRRREVFQFLATERGNAFLRQLQIKRVVDIGPPLAGLSVALPCEVKELGLLSTEQVSDELQNARFGLLDYPSARLTKSGIAAAYFAHAVCCLRTSGKQEGEGAPKPGIEYIDLPEMQDFELGDLKAVAEAGYRWYRGHTLIKVAGQILGVSTV